jgi:hypothetical protein
VFYRACLVFSTFGQVQKTLTITIKRTSKMDVATHLEARVTRAILTGNTGIKRCYKKDIFPSIFFSLSELKTFLGNISVQMPMF